MRMPWSVRVGSLAGIGFVPWGPGTWASLVVALLVGWMAGRMLAPLTVVLTMLSFASAPGAVRYAGRKDPGFFVMDEAAGMAIALWGVQWGNADPTTRWLGCAAAFGLFRFFDIAKPLGIRWLDRKGWVAAVTLDDLLAGVYALVVMRAAAVLI